MNTQLRGRLLLRRAVLHLGRPLLHDSLARVWWVVLLRAVLAVLLGAFTLVEPRYAAHVLVALFGVYALIDGCTALFLSARAGGLRLRWWMVLEALASIVAGMFALAEPVAAALLMITIMGAWLIVRGLSQVMGAITTRDELRGDWSLAVDGLMSALFGAGLIALPRIGALGLVWALGGWAVIHGVLTVPFALRLCRGRGERDGAAAGPGAVTPS